MNVWAWAGPLTVIILIIVVVIIVLVIRRWRKQPRVASGRMSRFTASFRHRLGKEGISNPVFVLDNVRIQNARTLPRTSDNSASVTDAYTTNNNMDIVHADRDSSVYDLATSTDIKNGQNSKISTLETIENVYVQHEMPSRELQPSLPVNQPPLKAVKSFLHSRTDTRFNIQQNKPHVFQRSNIKPLVKENSDDQVYETVSNLAPVYDTPKIHAPDTDYDTPTLHVPDTNYDIPKSPTMTATPSPRLGNLPPTPEPTKKAPKLPKEQQSKRRGNQKRSRNRKPPPIYGNVELESSETQRVSSGSVSEDGRNSGEYLNVEGMQLLRSRPHRAIAEVEDAYDFAPRTPNAAEDIYIDHSPGNTLSPGQSPDVAMSEYGDVSYSSNSDNSNVYDSIEEENSPSDEPVIGTDIENPLFGMQELTDLYDIPGEPVETWGTVTLGNDHVYDTVT